MAIHILVLPIIQAHIIQDTIRVVTAAHTKVGITRIQAQMIITENGIDLWHSSPPKNKKALPKQGLFRKKQ
jgi:hypothetical protein